MKKILIIEDDDLFRPLLAEWLRGAGYLVREAPDGRRGVHLLFDEPVDLVLTDLVMPGQEGIATVMHLRREYPHLPVIAMSGAARSITYLELARKLGAWTGLQKPFPPNALLNVVEALLAGRALGFGDGDASPLAPAPR